MIDGLGSNNSKRKRNTIASNISQDKRICSWYSNEGSTDVGRSIKRSCNSWEIIRKINNDALSIRSNNHIKNRKDFINPGNRIGDC
jgi:hypothetical protein